MIKRQEAQESGSFENPSRSWFALASDDFISAQLTAAFVHIQQDTSSCTSDLCNTHSVHVPSEVCLTAASGVKDLCAFPVRNPRLG